MTTEDVPSMEKGWCAHGRCHIELQGAAKLILLLTCLVGSQHQNVNAL
jgi:hypothetical protein